MASVEQRIDSGRDEHAFLYESAPSRVFRLAHRVSGGLFPRQGERDRQPRERQQGRQQEDQRETLRPPP
jgi:hypothetical protein